MDNDKFAAAARRRDVQQAKLALNVGERRGLTVEVTVTSSGLLAIGVLVSGILLSTAVIVETARRR